LENAGTAAVRLQRGTNSKLTNYDRALAWGYVSEQDPNKLPTVAQLKQALIEHGPLAMPIYSDNCFNVYQSGVFNGHNDTADVNHMMVLIGWDDEKQAWLIKNSWGEAWGEKGYGWVAYGSNNIGLFAAWIQPTPSTLDQ
jgi:cathepsin L